MVTLIMSETRVYRFKTWLPSVNMPTSAYVDPCITVVQIMYTSTFPAT